MRRLLKLAHTRGAVSDEAFARICSACGDVAYVLEIAGNVAPNILTNYVNRLAETELDFPVLD